MNQACMERMGARELDGYARVIGIDATSAEGAGAKARLIGERRGRVATVRILGMDMEVPVKRAHDKRASDLLARADKDDAAAEELMELMLGEEQWGKVVEACTDGDGTVDVHAMAFAYLQLVGSAELKNF